MTTYPCGATSRKWSAAHDQCDNPIVNIRFDAAACAACPIGPQCTPSAHGPREMTVRPHPQHEAPLAARQKHLPDDGRERVATKVRGDMRPGRDIVKDRVGIEGGLDRLRSLFKLGDVSKREYLAERSRLQRELTELQN
jgi:hypothetical protein